MEGAFVHDLYMDGASWDCQLNSIVALRPKEMLCAMPVIYIKSIVQEKQELQRVYECPLYKTRWVTFPKMHPSLLCPPRLIIDWCF